MKTKKTRKPRFQTGDRQKPTSLRLNRAHSEALNLIAKTGDFNVTNAIKQLISEKIEKLNLEDSENPLKKGEILESINEILRKINTLNHKLKYLPTLQKMNNILKTLKIAEQAFDE
jgi:hypothetical protein